MTQGETKINAIVFRQSLLFAFSFAALMWAVKGYEWLSGVNLSRLGVYPRTLKGMIGIIASPLVHGDSFHLLSNTFPIVMLCVGLFYFYHNIAPRVFLLIYFLPSFSVWIVAREAWHIGASGVVYGLVSFLFFIGLFRKDSASMTVSLIVLFLYSGMLGGLFPGDLGISYESHLMGAFVGLAAAFFYRKSGRPVEPDEGEEDEDDQFPADGFSGPSHTYGEDVSFKYELKKK